MKNRSRFGGVNGIKFQATKIKSRTWSGRLFNHLPVGRRAQNYCKAMQLTAIGVPLSQKRRSRHQIFLAMKCTIILLLAACLQVSANGHAQTISVKLRDIPFEKALKEISQKSGYGLFYLQEQIKEAKPVTISKENVDVKDVLNELFKEQPLKYEITNKTIVVSPKEAKKGVKEIKEGMSVEEVPAFPPSDITVKGRVTNDNGEPVPGASVLIKGTKRGTSADANGNFTLTNVDENATLVISGANIESVEMKVQGRTELSVRVKMKISELEEVIVGKGYYEEKQKYSVSNVTRISSADIEKSPVNNVMLALQGRVPGLDITQLTGNNGGAVKIRIQGENSIANGNNPLIIVDGVPYPMELPANDFIDNMLGSQYGSPLSFINPNDIESIDILKDADATSIYGSRAANGAILITTKKGKPGKMKLNVNLQQGWSSVARFMDVLDRRQYLDMRYEALRNSNLIPTDRSGQGSGYSYAPDLTIWDTTRYTNWQKELIGGTAQFTNYNASLSGGSSQANYIVGLTYSRNTDVYPGNHALNSGALHFSINTASLNQKFKMQLTGNYTINQNTLPSTDLTSAAIRLAPVAPSLILSDTINWAPDALGMDTWDNPLANTYHAKIKSQARTINNNLTLNYELMPGLELRSQFGFNQIVSESSRQLPLVSIRPSLRPTRVRAANFDNSTAFNYIIEPQVNYSKRSEKLQINALVGATIQQSITSNNNTNADGYNSDLLLNGLAGATTATTYLNKSFYKYTAAFMRFGIILKDQFMLNLTGRRDGSSRFGEKRRFHNIGSVGLGWIFSEMKFIKSNTPFLNFGKLRMSYGTTGSDQVQDYSFLSSNLSNGSASDILYQGLPSYYAAGLLNPYLHWEETRKWQLGIDLGFLKDRIQISLTYARNRSSNQLIRQTIPDITGFSQISINLPATLQNTNIELSLRTVNIKNRNLTWKSSINLTIPNNKVIAFPDIQNTPYSTPFQGIVVGQPRGIIWLNRYRGVDPLSGSILLQDASGNPSRFGSYTQFVSLLPKFYSGFENTITYKNLSISFLLQPVNQLGTRAFDFWNGAQYPGYFSRGMGNQPINVLNRWQKPGDQGNIPLYSANTTNLPSIPTSDAYYSPNASFVRLKNLSISWELPSTICKKLGLQSGRIYGQGQNLFSFTKFSGLDPENQSSTSLPPLRTWTFGLNVGF